MEKGRREIIIAAAHSVLRAFQAGDTPRARALFWQLREALPALGTLVDPAIETLLLDLEFLVEGHGSVSVRELYLELTQLAT